MSPALFGVLLLAALVSGGWVGFWLAVWQHARLDLDTGPRLVERMWIRRERRRVFRAKRAEFIRTGVIAAPRVRRVETW